MEAAGWAPEAAHAVADGLGDEVARVLRFAAEEVVPRLDGTAEEIPRVLHALDGGFIPAGPSGSPLRGLVNVLPTGRNFYSVDPKAVPSRLAWETGQAMAESLLERYRRDHDGAYPRSVGLSRVGHERDAHRPATTSPRCFALLGVRPVWDETSRRVAGLEVIDLDELGRPRIDVTVRISGFFRDAFPHVLALLDDAVQLVAALDEPAEQNFVARARRRARPARCGSSAPSPARTARGCCSSSTPAAGATTPTSPRSTPPGAATPTAAASTASPPAARWRPRTGGSRSRRRTPTPASTTSPTPTTTTSTTAAWSRPSAR